MNQQKPLTEIEIRELDPWEAWMVRNYDGDSIGLSNYDKVCELAISAYNLNKKSNKMDFQDLITCLCQWWFDNKRFMKKYNTYAKLGAKMGGRDHASILHHIRHRAVTANYIENTKCIRDFLES